MTAAAVAETTSGPIGEAAALCRLYAPLDRPMVLVGPIGAGKTTLGRLVHAASGRRGNLVAVSGGEVSESLFLDALFGHVPGAFTGATSTVQGAFQRASGGTIFFDDLTYLPGFAQPALLRALEDRRVTPLGAARDIPITCREVFATTVEPDELVSRGRLIPDLESRMGELIVRVPGLLERRDEIPRLAERLLGDMCAEMEWDLIDISEDVHEILACYHWPKNVRELRAVVERAAVHARGDAAGRIETRHLPERLRTHGAAPSVSLTPTVVRRAVERAEGNRSRAARALGVHRNTVTRYLKTLGSSG